MGPAVGDHADIHRLRMSPRRLSRPVSGSIADRARAERAERRDVRMSAPTPAFAASRPSPQCGTEKPPAIPTSARLDRGGAGRRQAARSAPIARPVRRATIERDDTGADDAADLNRKGIAVRMFGQRGRPICPPSRSTPHEHEPRGREEQPRRVAAGGSTRRCRRPAAATSKPPNTTPTKIRTIRLRVSAARAAVPSPRGRRRSARRRPPRRRRSRRRSQLALGQRRQRRVGERERPVGARTQLRRTRRDFTRLTAAESSPNSRPARRRRARAPRSRRARRRAVPLGQACVDAHDLTAR